MAVCKTTVFVLVFLIHFCVKGGGGSVFTQRHFRRLENEVALLKEERIVDRLELKRLQYACELSAKTVTRQKRGISVRGGVAYTKAIDDKMSKLEQEVEMVKSEVVEIKSAEDRDLPAVKSGLEMQGSELTRLLNLTALMSKELRMLTLRTAMGQPTRLGQQVIDTDRLTNAITNLESRVAALEDYKVWDEFYTKYHQRDYTQWQYNISDKLRMISITGSSNHNGNERSSISENEDGSGAGAISEDQLLTTTEVPYLADVRQRLDAMEARVEKSKNQIEHNENLFATTLTKSLEKYGERMEMLEKKKADVLTFQSALRQISKLSWRLDIVNDTLSIDVEKLEDSVFLGRRDTAQIRAKLAETSQSANRARAVATAIRSVQGQQFGAIRDFNTKLNQMDTDLLKFGYKLTSLQADYLNSTLRRNRKSETEHNLELAQMRLTLRVEEVESTLPTLAAAIKVLSDDMSTKINYSHLKSVKDELEIFGEKMSQNDARIVTNDQRLDATRRAVERLEVLLPEDCSTYFNSTLLLSKPGRIVPLKPKNTPVSFLAYCRHDGYTVIQHRSDQLTSFNRSWFQYASGFGRLGGDFWLGNERLHSLTSQRNRTMNLRIEVRDIYGDFHCAEYSNFSIAPMEDNYRLGIDHRMVVGNLSDTFWNHNGMQFSTYDRDNDASSTHCARYYACGWWFSHCQKVNLNGNFYLGMVWYDNSTGDWLQLRETTMLVG